MSDFSLLIKDWYRQNHRKLPWRSSNDPYFIWLSEVILQQTRVEQGMNYYLKFTENYPTVTELAHADESSVLKDWQGLGYYSRARNLHAAAKYISNELNGNFPNNYKDLLSLKGVGEYTAAAISSIAFNEERAVVDGNVYRVLSRVFEISTPIDSTKGKKEFQELASELISSDNPGEHNQALMEIGAMICKPANPICNECPLGQICLARASNTFDQYPVKTKKIKVRDRYFHYFIFNDGGKTIVEKRNEKDIWQNMFQFPLIEGKKMDLSRYGEPDYSSDIIKHILSHQRIHTTFHHFNFIPETLEKSHQVIEWKKLDELPIPRLIDKYLESHYPNA